MPYFALHVCQVTGTRSRSTLTNVHKLGDPHMREMERIRQGSVTEGGPINNPLSL